MLAGIGPGPGYSSVGGVSGVIVYGLDTPQFSTDFNHTLGQHSLKYGALITMPKPHVTLDNAGAGSVSFSSLPRFLVGGPVQQFSALAPDSTSTRIYRYNTFGFYLQDDMRLADNFTLNAGLRYEFNTVPNEVDGLNACIKDITPRPPRNWTARSSSSRRSRTGARAWGLPGTCEATDRRRFAAAAACSTTLVGSTANSSSM